MLASVLRSRLCRRGLLLNFDLGHVGESGMPFVCEAINDFIKTVNWKFAHYSFRLTLCIKRGWSEKARESNTKTNCEL